MPNISELLQASLRANKPKTLSGLSQKATQSVAHLQRAAHGLQRLPV
jgi:hypothetical protein